MGGMDSAMAYDTSQGKNWGKFKSKSIIFIPDLHFM